MIVWLFGIVRSAFVQGEKDSKPLSMSGNETSEPCRWDDRDIGRKSPPAWDSSMSTDRGSVCSFRSSTCHSQHKQRLTASGPPEHIVKHCLSALRTPADQYPPIELDFIDCRLGVSQVPIGCQFQASSVPRVLRDVCPKRWSVAAAGGGGNKTGERVKA